MKRVFDIIGSGCALILLSPILIVLAIWIKVDSPGRILFRQWRIGRNKKKFRILKFGTMLERDPDRIDQRKEAVLVEGDDPRITRAGRVLRKYSLDELPQLINILIGDMSVVGPRPIIPEQLEVVPERYASRFDVQPGLTGLAQVRGRRGLDWLVQLAADAEYARDFGFAYDISLILKTFGVVLGAKGIYGDDARNWRYYRDHGIAEAEVLPDAPDEGGNLS